MGGDSVSGWQKKQMRLPGRIRAVPHLFAKTTVVYCVLYATAACTYSLWKQAHGGSMEGTLATVLGFFGGELLLLCLKTILKKEEKSYESSADEQNRTVNGARYGRAEDDEG